MIENNINEDYPQSFDWEEFKKFKSFNKRVKYCNEHLRRVGSGSSRIAYIVDEFKVLKLAKNVKGIAQNEKEVDIFNDGYLDSSSVFGEIYDYDKEYNLWLEMEICKKVTPSMFKSKLGISFNEYNTIIQCVAYDSNPKRERKPSQMEYEFYSNYMENPNEFVEEMCDYLQSFTIPSGDLQRVSSYGINKNDEIVLIDYGLDWEVFSTYYSK